MKLISRNNVLMIIAIAVIAIAVSAAVAGTLSKHQDTSGKVSANYVLGASQQARTSVFLAAIVNVDKNNKKDYAFAYDNTQDTMLIADVKVTNLTNQPQILSPSTQFYIRTSDGLMISMHPSMYVRNQLQFTQVAPHAEVTGQISFVIPSTLKRPLLYVDLGWDNHVPVIFDILH